jgi:hypothetical protein
MAKIIAHTHQFQSKCPEAEGFRALQNALQESLARSEGVAIHEGGSSPNTNQAAIPVLPSNQPNPPARQLTALEQIRADLERGLFGPLPDGSSRMQPCSTPRRPSRFQDLPDSAHNPPTDPAAQCAYWESKALQYQEQRDDARRQHDKAETHCVLAQSLIETLQRKLNTKLSKSKRRNVRVPSGNITCEQGREIVHWLASNRQKKKAEEEAKQRKKLDVLLEQHWQCQPGQAGISFFESPPLKSMNKPDLRNVAWALGQFLGEDEQIDEKQALPLLKSAINAYFNNNPGLRTNPQFSPLFRTGGRSGAGPRVLNPSSSSQPPRSSTPPLCTNHKHPSILGEVTNTPRRRCIATSQLEALPGSSLPVFLPPTLHAPIFSVCNIPINQHAFATPTPLHPYVPHAGHYLWSTTSPLSVPPQPFTSVPMSLNVAMHHSGYYAYTFPLPAL